MSTATDTEPPPAPPPWAGWFRPHRGARFEQVVQAATFDLCWDQLLKSLAQHGRRGGDSTVLPRGTDPNAGASARRPASAGR